MGLADLHIHSTYSHDGTATVPAILEHVKRFTHLNVIALTDHDAIGGALRALELAEQYDLQVVPGIEVTTAEGHLLALFVTEVVPRDMSLLDTVICVGEMGGICIAPHPAGRRQGCLDEASLRKALANHEAADTLAAAECFNASLLNLRANGRAAALAHALKMSPVGSSDAHLLSMIGLGATRFPGADAAALRLALENRRTEVIHARRPWHYPFSYVNRRALRQLGLAHDQEAGPGAPITLQRLSPLEFESAA